MESPSFGYALLAAIKAEFGTQVSFSRRYGSTKAQISQFLSGVSPVKPDTLQAILECFETFELKQSVYAAWVRTYAPPPVVATEGTDPAELSGRVGELWAGGKPREALRVAASAAPLLAGSPLRLKLLGTEALIHLRLRQRGAALGKVRTMWREADAAGDRLSVLDALWINALALQGSPGIGLPQQDRARKAAADYLESCGEATRNQAGWEYKRAQMHRDAALDILAVHARRRVGPEALGQAARMAGSAVSLSPDAWERNLSLEVRARVETALGDAVTAEATLEEIPGLAHGMFDDGEKVGLTQARILLVKGEFDHAASLLGSVAAECLMRENLHHFEVAEGLLAGIEADRFPPTSVR